VLRILDFSSIPEPVAVLVSAFRQFVVQADRINSKLRQSMEFVLLRNPIVICVLP
jgi:hypothetical protein